MSSDSPAAPPYYALTSDDHAALVVVASIVFLVYAILGTITKLLIRLNITSMRDYDLTLLVGLVLYFVQTACVIAACKTGLGQHYESLSSGSFERYSKVGALDDPRHDRPESMERSKPGPYRSFGRPQLSCVYS